jgi:1-acyl-sn-glycerol-3-phosphate acyltransferase
MMTFAEKYRSYIRTSSAGSSTDIFGFDLASVAKIEPLLSALYKDWWRVKFLNLDLVPKEGPALIAANAGGVMPWAALMFMYALMRSKTQARRLNIMMHLDWIEDERVYRALTDVGFVPWSATHAQELFAAGELVLVFPEGAQGFTKPYSERYRLLEFDWIQFLPAIEANVPIYLLATLGSDESIPVFANLEALARQLGLPSYPVTPFFPWLPFPANFLSLPVPWTMSLLRQAPYKTKTERHELEETARREALHAEGEIQAELNRLFRGRVKKPR